MCAYCANIWNGIYQNGLREVVRRIPSRRSCSDWSTHLTVSLIFFDTLTDQEKRQLHYASTTCLERGIEPAIHYILGARGYQATRPYPFSKGRDKDLLMRGPAWGQKGTLLRGGRYAG